jgi:MFS family permease
MLTKTLETTRGSLLSLILVSTAHATNHIYQLAPSIIAGKIQSEYGLSPFEVGLIFLAFNLPYAIFQAPFGALSRRLGRKRLMVVGFLVNAAAFAGVSILRGVMLLAIVLFIAGVGGSTYHSLGIPLISDLFPARRGEALGYHQTGGSIGSFVAPLIIGALAETSGWRYALLITSILGFALAPVLWYRLRDSPVEVVESYRPSIRELKTPLLLVLAAAIYIVAFRGLQLFGTLYFEQGKGLGPQAYVLFSLSQVAGIFSGPVCGRLSDIMDRRKVILSLVLVEGASAFGLVFLRGIPLYLALVVFGFAAFGLLATMDAYMADITRPQLFGTVVGINMAASFVVSSVLSPVLGSSIGAYGYDFSFTVLAAFTQLSVPLILSVRRPRERL